MSLDVYLEVVQPVAVYERNITHNLGRMAEAAGIYEHVWRPEKIGVTTARQLIEPLRAGLAKLEASPGKFKQYDPPNGWGKYEDLVAFITEYLAACEANPDAAVRASR